MSSSNSLAEPGGKLEVFEPRPSASATARTSTSSWGTEPDYLPQYDSSAGSDHYSGSTNHYERYFFGPVDNSDTIDDDPGPQLDAVLRTLSKLTTRLDNSEGLDKEDTEEEDSFLDNLLQGGHSGYPPLAPGEEDSNETTSPTEGSLAPPELEHDSHHQQSDQNRQNNNQNLLHLCDNENDEEQPVFV